MANKDPIRPPRWATKLLTWYCKPRLLEDLQGDLNEYFERNLKEKGVRRARWIYILDVLKFFRLYTVRKPEFLNLLTHSVMIGSYIKTSGRSIARNKLFSAINIIGLAISMSVGLLLIGLLSDMSKYDRFHEKGDRIFRVISRNEYLGNEDRTPYASTSLKAGYDIKQSIPGIEAVSILYYSFNKDVTTGEKTIPLKGLWANESFLSMFSFPLLHGEATSALKNPYSIVLTESSAKKLFGDTNAVGKTLTLAKGQDYLVTGVIKDIPRFSHLRFEMLGSLSTREITEKNNTYEQWDHIWSAYVYVLLPEGTDLQNLQDNLNKLSVENDKTVRNRRIRLGLQPLFNIASGESLNNSIGPVMGKKDVWMIGILSFVVILSACFNYTNLSIARSLRRSREVGIRKVIGAFRAHVLAQFIIEAIIIACIALVLSFGLFILLKPFFLSVKPKLQDMVVLDLSPALIVYFIVLALFVGVAGGFFPALFYSRVNAIHVLKGTSSFRPFRNLNMRKALIVLQYTFSLSFIATTIIGYQQYRHFVSFDLGFSTDNILNINLQGNKPALLAKELSEMPEVKGFSTCSMITSLGGALGMNMKYTDPLDSTFVVYNVVDENYLSLHDYKLLAGRNFRPKPGAFVESEVIVNEEVLKYFNIGGQNPQKAVGEVVFINRKPMQIIGVAKNFYNRKADSRIEKQIFRYSNEEAGYMNAKIVTSDWPGTLAKIETAWKKIDGIHPLRAEFYQESIERSFKDTAAMVKVIGFLAFIAVFISSMGLLGMVVYTTETRIKEVSLRKVLGATEGSLIYMLSKGFLSLLVLAGVIAIPVTYFFFDQVVLDEMVNRAPLTFGGLLTGIMCVMAIALIMMGSQTLKVARTNPAEILKNE